MNEQEKFLRSVDFTLKWEGGRNFNIANGRLVIKDSAKHDAGGATAFGITTLTFKAAYMAGFVGLLGWFFGGLDGYIKVLIACTVIDYATGICAAGIEGKLSSAEGFKRIARKVTMFLFVGLAHIIEQLLPDSKGAFRIAIIFFYIGNERISIIENADKLGVPIPKLLRGRFLEFTKKISRRPKNRPLYDLVLSYERT